MMKLVISNKPYSPWPMRVWLLMRELGLVFEEQIIDLSGPDKIARLRAVSPSGRVPVLLDGAITVWDSLSIIEYLAERFPTAGVWPAAAGDRAHARSIVAEMHAGFTALRGQLVMNMRRNPRAIDLKPEVQADLQRIFTIWTDTRERFGKGGPFLFGRFSAADAYYAPIVSRLYGYAVEVPAACRPYMDVIQSLPAYKAWRSDCDLDPWFNEKTDNL